MTWINKACTSEIYPEKSESRRVLFLPPEHAACDNQSMRIESEFPAQFGRNASGANGSAGFIIEAELQPPLRGSSAVAINLFHVDCFQRRPRVGEMGSRRLLK